VIISAWATLAILVIQRGDIVALEVVPALFCAKRQQEHFSLWLPLVL
jgi:hypothetical protein